MAKPEYVKKRERATVRLDAVSWGVLLYLESQCADSKGVILLRLINKGQLSPFPTPKELPIEHSVSLRLSSRDLKKLHKMAADHGVTTGEIARRLLRGVTHDKAIDLPDVLS